MHYRPEIDGLRAHSPDSRVVVIGGVPHWGKRGLPNRILRQARDDHTVLRTGLRLPAELDKVQARDVLLRTVAGDVAFISLLDGLCEQDKCVALVTEDGQAAPIAWDYGHLTKGGSLYTSAMVQDAVAPELSRLSRP